METAGWQQQQPSPGGVPQDQRIRIDGPILSRENKVEVVKRVMAFSWQPKKGLAEDMVDKASNTLDDSEDLESGAEDCYSYDDGGSLLTDDEDSLLTDTDFPEIKTSLHYEKEDWDKELADYEYNSEPYDFDDIIHYESFQDQAAVAPCSLQGEPLYDPSSHHVAPLTWGPLETVTVDGQFDDATD
ncbi:coordinator of PRMT5 and differentiation stimulator [Tiliqua scincoides]|uniref:coordinator of PRMT5 and differentiation stimulator n=1 Tax=Tiliqua scincoides TaxID=71010 RepID=UPI003462463D